MPCSLCQGGRPAGMLSRESHGALIGGGILSSTVHGGAMPSFLCCQGGILSSPAGGGAMPSFLGGEEACHGGILCSSGPHGGILSPPSEQHDA